MTARTYQSGIVILYAVIIVSIVLVVSLSLFNITYKQIILSLLIRESQVTQYTAGSMLDCVEYWDIYNDPSGKSPFGDFEINSSDPSQNQVIDPTFSMDYCGPYPITETVANGNSSNLRGTEVRFDIPADQANNIKAGCAVAKITKEVLPPSNQPWTTIRASGYNVACSDVDNSNFDTRKVERTLVLEYAGYKR
jgi:hypothetical protein